MTTSFDNPNQQKRIGLLAGGGRFPIAFAEAARNLGYYVYGLGVMGMAPPELADICSRYQTAPLARLEKPFGCSTRPTFRTS